MLSRAGLGLGGLTRGGAAAYVFTNAEAAALVARFTTPPTDARKLLIDTTVGSLKSSGIWAKADLLWFAGSDSQASRRNWVADLYNLTAVSGPTFTTDRGFTGDATAAYLESGFNPTSAPTPKYALNSSGFAFWSRTAGQVAGRDMGAASGGLAFIQARLGDETMAARNNRAVTGATPNTDGSGLFLANRTSSAGGELYRNNAGATVNSTSVSIPNATFRFLTGDGTFSSRQLSFGFVGASLATQERADLLTITQTYLQAIGAA